MDASNQWTSDYSARVETPRLLQEFHLKRCSPNVMFLGVYFLNLLDTLVVESLPLLSTFLPQKPERRPLLVLQENESHGILIPVDEKSV
jgi:hypothetical protein